MSPNGILEAEKIAQMVTNQLVAGQFTWDWFYALIGKDTSEAVKELTCREMVEEYKKHYFKQRTGNKHPESDWYKGYRRLERILGELDKPISLPLVREVIESTGNNSETRRTTLSGLAAFLKYFDNDDYKKIVKEYKSDNKVKRKKRNVPSDARIIEVYEEGFKIPVRSTKKYAYRFSQWRFLYALLATYGLRIHEAWHIANWDAPVTLKDGDWVKEFDLLQPFNLPDIKNPLKREGAAKSAYACTNRTSEWFRKKGYGFTPHDLRHAYNHRGHQSGYNPKVLADSLGHSMQMNGNNYLRHMSDSVKLKGMRDAMQKEKDKRSENELLKQENRDLKAQLEAAQNKIQLLETKLKLKETFERSE